METDKSCFEFMGFIIRSLVFYEGEYPTLDKEKQKYRGIVRRPLLYGNMFTDNKFEHILKAIDKYEDANTPFYQSFDDAIKVAIAIRKFEKVEILCCFKIFNEYPAEVIDEEYTFNKEFLGFDIADMDGWSAILHGLSLGMNETYPLFKSQLNENLLFPNYMLARQFLDRYYQEDGRETNGDFNVWLIYKVWP